MIWLIKNTLLALLALYIITVLVVYLKLGIFIKVLPWEIFEIIQEPFFRIEIFSLIFLSILIVGFSAYIKGEYRKYHFLKENRIYSVTLEEIAKIWNNHTTETIVKQTIPVLYFNDFKEIRTKEFIEKNIKKHIKFFSQEKIEIIFELLQILENDGILASSVASKFKSDPEMSGAYVKLLLPNLTSYDLFSQINLYTHTMNVADKIVEHLQSHDPLSFETSLCDAIIVALAHDLGKLPRINLYNKELDKAILQSNPHPALSAMLFREFFPGFEEIEQAILLHHGASTSTSNLVRAIVSADKEARKMEQALWFEQRKLQLAQESMEKTEAKPLEKELKKEKLSHDIELKIEEPASLKDRLKSFRSTVENLKVLEENIQEKDTSSYASPYPLEYSDEIEHEIFQRLKGAINDYGLEKIQEIKSISYGDSILYSIKFFSQIVEELFHSDLLSEDSKKAQGATKYIVSKLYGKGWTMFLKPEMGCSTFFLELGGKQYKYICVPLRASIFNENSVDLEKNKPLFLKKIIINEFKKVKEAKKS